MEGIDDSKYVSKNPNTGIKIWNIISASGQNVSTNGQNFIIYPTSNFSIQSSIRVKYKNSFEILWFKNCATNSLNLFQVIEW